MNHLFARLTAIMTITLVAATAWSCKDDEAAPSKRPLLVGKSWATVKYEIDGQDVTDEQEECEADNRTTFFSDGTFIDDIGDIPCDEFETNVDGTWVFKSNERIISIRPSGENPSDWDIEVLTDDTFRISQYVDVLQAEVVVTMIPL